MQVGISDKIPVWICFDFGKYLCLGIPLTSGGQGSSCDSLLNSVAEGGSWGEDDWEACEVNTLTLTLTLTP